jgi:uncharacterized membrane protein
VTITAVRRANDGLYADGEENVVAGSSTLWLTTLVFDGPYPEAEGVASAVASALTVDDSADADLATVLGVRWDLGKPRPRTLTLPVGDGVDDTLLEMVFTATFLLPLLDAATQSPPRAAGNALLGALGIDGVYRNRLRDTVVPGTWALLMLATRDQVDEVTDSDVRLRPRTRIDTVLSRAQADAVRETYGPEGPGRRPRR